jgi:hypothetical protein
MTYPMDHTAEVRAHNQVMRYRRFGTGPLLLLLGNSPRELWPALRERLAEHFKVIVPDIPPGNPDIAGWLCCLLDGLGATEIAVVAEDRLRDTASALACADGDYVGRVVLLPAELSVDEALSRVRRDLMGAP